MSKREGKGIKSFNKGFQVPDTYIIIFFVVVIAALLTFLVPKGFYETQDISYMINGVEKTRIVIKDGSFQYLTDDTGNVVTEGDRKSTRLNSSHRGESRMPSSA